MARGEGISILRSRRGMSPLIATILLMAFAVALGGMIMNLGANVTISDDCSEIDVTVTKFCTQDDSIVVAGRSSKESIPLTSVKLLVISGNIENLVNVGNSKLTPGQGLALNIPFAAADDAQVALIGVIGSKDNPHVCEDTPIERVNPIQPC